MGLGLSCAYWHPIISDYRVKNDLSTQSLGLVDWFGFFDLSAWGVCWAGSFSEQSKVRDLSKSHFHFNGPNPHCAFLLESTLGQF